MSTNPAIDLDRSGFRRRATIEGTPDEVIGTLKAATAALRGAVQMRMFEVADAPDVAVLSFTGKVQIDRSMEIDAAFLAAAELGRHVDLAVHAVIVGAGVDRKEGKEEDTDTLTVKLRIESVEIENS